MLFLKTKIKTKNRKNKCVFTKKDYASGDGMLTKVWGPAIWHALHTISFNYPVKPTNQDKQHYKAFVLNLQNVLPCKYCRINLKKNLKEMPLTSTDLINRNAFSKYIYRLHEHVNKMLKKESGLTFADVRERYEHFRSRCTISKKPKLKLNTIGGKPVGDDVSTSTLKTTKKESGCTEPMFGKKAKAIIKIVPVNKTAKTFSIDRRCIKTRKQIHFAKEEAKKNG